MVIKDNLHIYAYAESIIIMIDDSKNIVGQINISKERIPRKINGKNKYFWYFNRLFVRADYRNQGYAKFLLSKMINIKKKKKINLWLDINPYGDLNYNQLEKLYIRYGFKKYDYGYIFVNDPPLNA